MRPRRRQLYRVIAQPGWDIAFPYNSAGKLSFMASADGGCRMTNWKEGLADVFLLKKEVLRGRRKR